MKTFDKVVGYVWRAETFCPKCLRRKLFTEGKISMKEKSLPPEDLLDIKAEELGIDRNDEWSFDSDNFPKVIFATDVEFDDDICGSCDKTVYV